MSRLQKLHSPAGLVLLILAIATVVKWTWALFSAGTCDAIFFYKFAQSIDKHSLAYLYQNTELFNHTPLTGYLSLGLFKSSGRDYSIFAANFRAISILADIALVLGLLQVRKKLGTPPWWALCLFAASPVSIMVSGFHGNVDPIMTVFLFFAGVAVLHGRAAWSGALLALACNVKVVPLLVVPVFFFYWLGRERRATVRFTVAFSALMLAGFIKPLVECPADFAHNVLGYGSFWGGWGITYWLRLTGYEDFQAVAFHNLAPEQTRIMSVLKCVIIAATLTLAWRRRKVEPRAFFTSLAAAFVVFFVFTPGVGVQYMVWFAPFLLLFSSRWYAVVTAGSACFLFTFYHSTSRYHFPWDLAFPMGNEVPYWSPWTNLPWVSLIVLLATQWRSWFLLPAAAVVEAPAAVGAAGDCLREAV